MWNKRRIAALAGLLLLAALPVLGHWVRRAPEGRCALDGVAIVPIYQVRVRDGQGNDQTFCCIRCAELWLGRQTATPQAVTVTDEASGQAIEATAAYFVRSTVVTAPTTGNRVHAFADQADAERHAESAHGRLLTGTDRPFALMP
jgi:hypothetical protein